MGVETAIFQGKGREEYIGVLVYTINVGDFAFFRAENKNTADQFAVLVDGRAAPTRGSILQHPLLTQIAEKGGKPPEELLSMRVPEEYLGSDVDKLYVDPLGKHELGHEFARDYIAAAAPVRAPSIPGVAYNPETEDTGLDVLVQSEYDKVVRPVRELSERLLRNIVLMLAVVIITGIGVWALALRVFRDPKRPRLALPEADGPTPVHSMSTLEAPREK